jgi:hypothetical protein
MRIVTPIFGLLWTLVGMIFVVAVFTEKVSIWQAICALPSLIVGAIYFIAGVKGYRGDWPFILGSSYLAIGTIPLFFEIPHVMDGNSSGLGIAIFTALFLFLSGWALLKSGHKLHKYTLQVEQGHIIACSKVKSAAAENASVKSEPYSGKAQLITLATISFISGVINAKFYNTSFQPQLTLLEGILFSALVYFWYHKDKLYCKYKAGKFLNMTIAAFPIVAVPVYLFRSRDMEQSQKAFAMFLAIVAYNLSLMIAGGIAWNA